MMKSVFTHITESLTGLLVVVVVVFIIVYLLYRRRNVHYSGVKLPPAVPSLPIVGSMPFLPIKLEDLVEFCISARNKLGKIFSFRLGLE